jgi:microsomal dipeptidase-like Zn-dependent dipeptidase
MNRREFLLRSSIYGAALLMGNAACTSVQPTAADKEVDFIAGMRIIDPHQHPDKNPAASKSPHSASYQFMKAIGAAAGCYSAIGDIYNTRYYAGLSTYDATLRQLRWWLGGVIREEKVKLVLKAADIPGSGADRPGAILGIEGGDALSGKVERVDEFYKIGVRIITVVHYHNNEIGDIMKTRPGSDPGPYRGGLSREGRAIIDRMQEIGMVVDVAHTESATLQQIAEISRRPLIDSHTGLCRQAEKCGRSRTFEEMEIVAKTGGVVCTWPLGWRRSPQKTFHDWAAELMEMRKRIGMEHIGLGTDGGGGLGQVVEGYRDVRDLERLAKAMLATGFSREDIAAFMGGNIYRALTSSI